MGEAVIIDELHLTVRVPADLTDADREAVRRTLAGDAFADRLRAAVLAAVREFPTLTPATVTVSR